MGCIYKRGKTWWMAYTENGKQRCESCHTLNKRVAQKLLALRQAEILEGRFQLPSSRPRVFSHYAEEYLVSVPNLNTRNTYRDCIKSLLPFIGHLRLNQISVSIIDQFKTNRISEGVKGATINRALSVLRRMMRIAERRRFIASSQCARWSF